MPIRHDLTNQTFGNLIVIGPHRITPYGTKGRTRIDWFCHCACGNDVWRQRDALIQGQSDSCGCLAKARSLAQIHKAHEAAGKANRTHGYSGNNNPHRRLYAVWFHFKDRCNRPKCKEFKYYGGKGITYHPEWEQFEPFLKWSQKTGYNDTLTLERIDNAKGYFPENCKWIPKKEMTWNTTRSTRMHNGESLSSFCHHHDVPSDLVWHALKLKREYPEVWPFIVND